MMTARFESSVDDRPCVLRIGKVRLDGHDLSAQAGADVWACPLLGLVALAPFAGLLIPDGRVFPETVYSDYQSFQLPIRDCSCSAIAAGPAGPPP